MPTCLRGPCRPQLVPLLLLSCLLFLQALASAPLPAFQLFASPTLPPLRAVVYSPSLPSTPPPPHQADLYTFSHRHTHARDLALLTPLDSSLLLLLNSHAWHEAEVHTHFLHLVAKHNLSVALPFTPSYPVGTARWDVRDLRDRLLHQVEERFRAEVRRYQAMAAVRLWVVGDAPAAVGGSSASSAALSAHLLLCQRLMRVRDEECKDNSSWCHPLTTELGDSPPSFITDPLSYLHSLTPPPDLYLLRYRQPASTLPAYLSAFLRHQHITHTQSHPLLLLVSASAYSSAASVVNETLQSSQLIALVRAVEKYHRSVVLGVAVDGWLDEWWRADEYDRPAMECGPLDGSSHQRSVAEQAERQLERQHGTNQQEMCGYTTLATPQKHRVGRAEAEVYEPSFAVAYTGLMAHSLVSPFECVLPRLSYFALQHAWRGIRKETSAAWCEDGNRCCVFDRSSQGWALAAGVMAGLLACAAVHACWRRWAHRRLNVSTAIVRVARARSKARCQPHAGVQQRERLASLLAAALYRSALSATASSITSLHHMRIVQAVLSSQFAYIANHSASLAETVAILHSRTLSSYRAWCSAHHLKPRLHSSATASASDLLCDVCDYMLLWVAAEQLRRVPSFVCRAFHERTLDGVSAAIARLRHYELNYDDLDDTASTARAEASSTSHCRRPLRLLSRAISNQRSVFTYPLLGGWSGLLLLAWPLLHCHLLLYLLLVNVLSDPFRVEQGLIDLPRHLLSTEGADTWRLLIVVDGAMLVGGAVLDALLTATLRIEHAVSLLAGLLACQLMGALQRVVLLVWLSRLLSAVPLPTESELHVSYISVYATVRVGLFVSQAVYRLFTARKTHTLPGQIFAAIPTTESTSAEEAADRGNESEEVRHVDAPRSEAEQREPVRYHHRSCLTRSGHSLWLLARLSSLWLLVFVVKLLFDLNVLMPSVAGLAFQSLCAAQQLRPTEPMRLSLGMSAPASAHSLSALSASVSQQYACPVFLVSLHVITLWMCLATSYIAYIVVTSAAGVTVPLLLLGSRKEDRTALACLLVGLAYLLSVILAAGLVGMGVSWAVVLLFAGWLVAGRWRHASGIAECHQLVQAAAGSASTRQAEAEREQELAEGERRPDRQRAGAPDQQRLDASEEKQSAPTEADEYKRQPRTRAAKADPSALGKNGVSQPDSRESVAFTCALSSPALHGMRALLQCLFCHHLSLQQASRTWSAILHHMHGEDLLPAFHLLAESPMSLCHPSFLSSPSLTSLLPAVRDRLLFFFRSLVLVRSSDQLRTPSIARLAGCSVIVPINSETVIYRVEELLLDERWSRSEAVSAAGVGLRLIEFLVHKHRDEWDNLAERVAFELPVTVDSAADSDDKRRRRRGDALLDTFFAVHSSVPCQYTLQGFQAHSDEIVLWCSYRGQTLIRTVRGLSYTRLAFLHLLSPSSPHSLDDETVVDEKYQLLVGAQQYPHDERQRDDLHRLMYLFPRVELVYPLDVRRQQCDRVKRLQATWQAEHQLTEEQLRWWKMGKQQSGLAWSGGKDVAKSTSDDRKQADEYLAMERERVSTITGQALSHLDTHLSKLFDAMLAVFTTVGVRGGVGEQSSEDAKQEEEKEATPSARQSNAELVNLLGFDLPALHSDLTPSAIREMLAPLNVVWQDTLLHLHAQLAAIHQLQLRQGQHELHSTVGGHRLHSDNCLHAVAQWLWQLDKQADVQQLSERYIDHLHWMTHTEKEAVERWTAFDDCYARLHQHELEWQHKIRSEVSECGEMGSDMRQRWLTTLMDEFTQRLQQREQSHRSHCQLCGEQRRTVLAAMTRVHPLVEGTSLSLPHFSHLSKLLAAFQAALDQYRDVTHRRHCLNLLADTLGPLPTLLLREEAIVIKAITLAGDHAVLSAVTSLHSVSALLSHIRGQLQQVEQQQKRRPAVYQQSVAMVLTWLQAHGADVESAAANCPSYAAVMPALFSLLHNALHAHFTSCITLQMTDLLQSSAAVVPHPLPFSSIFQHLTHAAALVLALTQYYTVALLRCRSHQLCDSSARQHGTSVSGMLSCLHEAYIELVVHPYQSVHITNNPAASTTTFSPLVLHRLPRHHPLLLGSLPHPVALPVALPTTNPKSENQLHCLPFARHPLLQAVDMNQDFTFEEALKAHLFHAALQPSSPASSLASRFMLAGCGELIYSMTVGAVGRFMALQDTSFVMLGQRVLGYTAARLHYGHPDVFDGLNVRGGVGMSKASAQLNLSEDLFYGFDMVQRGGRATYVPYIRYGKGREVSLFNCTVFEDKLARGAALTLKSADVYRLSRQLDVLTYLSLYFGALGHFNFTLLFSYGITSFVYLLLLMSMSSVSSDAIGRLGSVYAIPWLFHLGFAFGLPLLCHLIQTDGLLYGVLRWAENLLLGSVYYLFQLRTKARGMEIGLSGGSGGYVSTGRGMCLYSSSLITLYTSYASSHLHHALYLLFLLLLFLAVFSTESPSALLLRVWAVVLACASWLLAPALFNPTLAACVNESTDYSEKWREWQELKAWMAAEYEGDGAVGCWERWWWHEKRSQLCQYGLRFHTTSRCGWRRYLHHPLSHALFSLLYTAVEAQPLVGLSFALVAASADLMLPLVVYGLVIALLVRLSSSLQWPFAIGLLVLCYCVGVLLSSHASLSDGWLVRQLWLIGWDRTLGVLMVLLAAALLAWVCQRLMLAAIDALHVWHIHAHVERAAARDNADALLSAPPDVYVRVMRRSVMFGFYRCVQRYVCPTVCGLLHLCVVCACVWLRDWHSWLLYGLDMRAVRQARRRRAQE